MAAATDLHDYVEEDFGFLSSTIKVKKSTGSHQTVITAKYFRDPKNEQTLFDSTKFFTAYFIQKNLDFFFNKKNWVDGGNKPASQIILNGEPYKWFTFEEMFARLISSLLRQNVCTKDEVARTSKENAEMAKNLELLSMNNTILFKRVTNRQLKLNNGSNLNFWTTPDGLKVMSSSSVNLGQRNRNGIPVGFLFNLPEGTRALCYLEIEDISTRFLFYCEKK